MSPGRWLAGILWLACLFLGQTRALAMDFFVHHPRDGQVVFGSVEVRLEVLGGAPIREIVVRLDGREVDRLTAEPFHTTVDVGEENRSHVFEFVATDVNGVSVTRTMVTGRIEVHFELDLGLQQLYVTVENGSQDPPQLAKHDFQVLDDRLAQDLVTFEDGNAPFTAALLVDSSRSMVGRPLASALAGARAFVAGMRPLDEAAVLVFSDRLQARTPFTADPEVVAEQVARVEASGGTAVYDHLYLALEQISRRQGRQVVILLSDGIDVESVLSLKDVEWKARRSQALIYWIRPRSQMEAGSSFFSFWRGAEQYTHDLEALERLVEGTGGRILEVDHIDRAGELLADILRELRRQYVLGYYPTRDLDDGVWHSVKVKLHRAGLKVRHREGYFDESP